MKKYIIIAGVNGAGKSTLYQTMDSLKQMPRINIDELVRGFGNWRNTADVMKAGKIAVSEIEKYFANNTTFNQETTLCGKSILRNIKRAKELGYQVELHYVGVDSVEIAKERIAIRVQKGGHGIPDADVERRYTESLCRLREVLPYCDTAIFYDNTKQFERFAIYQLGKITDLSEKLPRWFQEWND